MSSPYAAKTKIMIRGELAAWREIAIFKIVLDNKNSSYHEWFSMDADQKVTPSQKVYPTCLSRERLAIKHDYTWQR